MTYSIKNKASPYYVIILWVLTSLFLFRTIAQLIQYFGPVGWLPQLEAWQGSTLPYSFLLASQLLILIVMISITCRHASKAVNKNARRGKLLLTFGAVYFVLMSIRLIIGLAHLSNHPWFEKLIPAFFHLVLATFVLLIAGFHMNWLTGRNNKKLNGAAR